MWTDDFNDRYLPVSTSDFQSIITSLHFAVDKRFLIPDLSSSAWRRIPRPMKLVILRNDLEVYIVTSSKNGDDKCIVYLCSLEVSTERESFAKQVMKLYPFNRMLLLLMTDGDINIFDAKGGLFLWKTETFKSNSPQIWVRKGLFPTIGVWNRSGIWNLRSKPIADQIKALQTSREPEEKENEGMGVYVKNLADVDFALDVFDGQKKSYSRKQRRRIKQGVNRSTDLPMEYYFQILSLWKLTNLSTDVALNAAVKIKEVLNEAEEDVDIDDVICTVNAIQDPVLLMVLFSDRNLPSVVKKHLLQKLEHVVKSPASRNLDENVLNLLKEYLAIEEDIKNCFFQRITVAQ